MTNYKKIYQMIIQSLCILFMQQVVVQIHKNTIYIITETLSATVGKVSQSRPIICPLFQ